MTRTRWTGIVVAAAVALAAGAACRGGEDSPTGNQSGNAGRGGAPATGSSGGTGGDGEAQTGGTGGDHSTGGAQGGTQGGTSGNTSGGTQGGTSGNTSGGARGGTSGDTSGGTTTTGGTPSSGAAGGTLHTGDVAGSSGQAGTAGGAGSPASGASGPDTGGVSGSGGSTGGVAGSGGSTGGSGGIDCGTCGAHEVCNGSTGTCECSYSTCGTTCCAANQACAGSECCDIGRACGASCCPAGELCTSGFCCDVSSACGGECCSAGQQCAGSHCVDACVPWTCEDLGVDCGTWHNGCGGDLTCGGCATGEHCTVDGSCRPTCVPETCASLGMDCGSWDNGCGSTAECGACAAGASCVDGTCISCTPDCSGRTCGPDGCGGSCGSCLPGQTCQSFQCVGVCTPSCSGRECGDDGCGGTSCGTCARLETCVAGVCLGKGADCEDLGTCVLNGCPGSAFPLSASCVGTSHSGCPACVTNCLSRSAGTLAETEFWALATCLRANNCWPGARTFPSCMTTGACAAAYADCRSSCVPSCTNRECGSNTCGGSCGTCPSNEVCVDGQCLQACSCGDRNCGVDPICHRSCGTCAADEYCDGTGHCQCAPNCDNRECGPDPVCQTSCGTCSGSETCVSGKCIGAAPTLGLVNEDGRDFGLRWVYDWPPLVSSCSYVVEESRTSPSTGFAPLPTISVSCTTQVYTLTLNRAPGTYYYRVRANSGSYSSYSNVVTVVVRDSACNPACPSNATCTAQGSCSCNDPDAFYDPWTNACLTWGGACQGVDTLGHCIDDTYWAVCDQQGELSVFDCQAAGCYNVDGDGDGYADFGGCGCTPGDEFCASARNSTDYEYRLTCVDLSPMGINGAIMSMDDCYSITGGGFCSWLAEVGMSCFTAPCEIYWMPSGPSADACWGDCNYDSAYNMHACF